MVNTTVDVYISRLRRTTPNVYNLFTLFALAILHEKSTIAIGRKIIRAMDGLKTDVKRASAKRIKRKRILNGSIYNDTVYQNALKTRSYKPHWHLPIQKPYPYGYIYKIPSNNNVNNY